MIIGTARERGSVLVAMVLILPCRARMPRHPGTLTSWPRSVAATLWIAYFLRSERVKNTFIR